MAVAEQHSTGFGRVRVLNLWCVLSAPTSHEPPSRFFSFHNPPLALPGHTLGRVRVLNLWCVLSTPASHEPPSRFFSFHNPPLALPGNTLCGAQSVFSVVIQALLQIEIPVAQTGVFELKNTKRLYRSQPMICSWWLC